MITLFYMLAFLVAVFVYFFSCFASGGITFSWSFVIYVSLGFLVIYLTLYDFYLKRKGKNEKSKQINS